MKKTRSTKNLSHRAKTRIVAKNIIDIAINILS